MGLTLLWDLMRQRISVVGISSGALFEMTPFIVLDKASCRSSTTRSPT
jgi:hypothetical protein